jgi:hypothetical protein
MSKPAWALSDDERELLGAALDALLPPSGSFPFPSQTGMIDEFILRRLPEPVAGGVVPYPRIDRDGLRSILSDLIEFDGRGDMTAALEQLQQQGSDEFTALWRLAVFGYYSRPETIAAIQRDLTPGYHGAPLPLGYNHVIAPWDPTDPLQMPQRPRGSYVPTDEVRRVDLEWDARRGVRDAGNGEGVPE